jgi:hypothetical protein
MDGSETLGFSSTPLSSTVIGLSPDGEVDGASTYEMLFAELALELLLWSGSDELDRAFFKGERSAGVRERFSPRRPPLLSVSATEVAALDIRRES